jgi:hypothetical protein
MVGQFPLLPQRFSSGLRSKPHAIVHSVLDLALNLARMRTGIEFELQTPPTRFPVESPQFGRAKVPYEVGRHLWNIGRIAGCQRPVDTVFDQLRNASYREGNDGLSERHGLKERSRQRILVHTGNDSDVEVANVRFHVLPKTDQQNMAFETDLFDESAALGQVIDRSVLRRVAEYDEAAAVSLTRRKLVKSDSSCADHLEIAFARKYSTMTSEDDGFVRESELSSKGARSVGKLQCVDRVVHYAHFRRRALVEEPGGRA